MYTLVTETSTHVRHARAIGDCGMRLNKLSIDKISIPPVKEPGKTAQERYYDDSLKGFGVRITSGGTKAFFVEKAVNRKLRRITLGHYPGLTVEMARKEAQKLLGQIAIGIDPIIERQKLKIQSMTLIQLFENYKTTRKGLKKNTLLSYNGIIKLAFSEWQQKMIIDINREMVAKKHQELGEKSGPKYANAAMRVLRALFNFAMAICRDSENRPLILENPVNLLSQTRAWFPCKPRQTCIKKHELPSWFQEVSELENETIRDYLLFTLLTGLRRQESATLEWEQVDLVARTFTLVDTKNNRSHTLPLSDFLYQLLMIRKQSQTGKYVFPGAGQNGFLVDPRRQIDKVTEKTGIKFGVHDLRRTFITIAESLDISSYVLKRLLNHKSRNDITADYIIIDVERLRKPMQLITDYLHQSMPPKLQDLHQFHGGVEKHQFNTPQTVALVKPALLEA